MPAAGKAEASEREGPGGKNERARAKDGGREENAVRNGEWVVAAWVPQRDSPRGCKDGGRGGRERERTRVGYDKAML